MRLDLYDYPPFGQGRSDKSGIGVQFFKLIPL